MRKIVCTGLLFFCAWAHAETWQLLQSDESSRLLLDADSLERTATGETRFQIKRVYSAQKDMMGLQYNATRSRYVLACQTGLVLSRQQFLLQDDEVVWTFPESDKAQKSRLELPDAVLGEVCRSATDGLR